MGHACSSLANEAFVVPAFPVYRESLRNDTFISSLCWPVADLGIKYCKESKGYLAASQIANMVASLVIAAAGLLALLNSSFSDEVGDLASAMTVVHGIFGCLAHATQLRVLEEADMLSMLIFSLFFFKGMVRALFPVINRSQYMRTVLNFWLVSTMFTAACWTSFNVPPSVYNGSVLSRHWASDVLTPVLWLTIALITFGVFLLDPGFLTQVRLRTRRRERAWWLLCSS